MQLMPVLQTHTTIAGFLPLVELSFAVAAKGLEDHTAAGQSGSWGQKGVF